ncbi:hypothetical protein EPJ64_10100 [Brachyspira aalborgi]|jgi:hypothetical protein|uniref:Uncharacterized protein n=1 Tax=Brachyspira aalborgi TaxID=29522 RepID=A0AB38PWX7_9SPIR|nr:hypothetical protein [Brachyspira aalborgi]MBS4762542.1 hypothetical protein [Brachyspira sp.]CCY75477.1 unknown [Brachyspira sp. CAG:700]TXJ15110.1 hypothetical protein EPJ77_08120 [Brachyspira aalborgi]TXJ18253.1 hypothetical protein EPJ64_10100 [Brachyspira aalborgi]TXJ24210.1 hypothetical protein EPJ73_10195 [Brachyspira aalborgi]
MKLKQKSPQKAATNWIVSKSKNLLFTLIFIASLFAISCSVDNMKPEDLKVDLSKERGSGRYDTGELTTTKDTVNNKATVLVNGSSTTSTFLYTLLTNTHIPSDYRSANGAGVVVTDIIKVVDTAQNIEITGGVTIDKNDAGGVYRINIPDSGVTNIKVEYNYKLKYLPSSAPQTDHTVFKVNSDTTNWTSLDLYKEIAGSTENSLFGKTYIIETAASLSANPATFTKGLITTNVLTTTVSANGGTYKLWIY